MKLHYKEVGNTRCKQTIIFLHEGLGCVEMWRDYPEHICTDLDLRGIVYDRAGYGKSQGSLINREASYLHEGALELRELILALNIQHPILYGHSDGGSIALIYAAQYPSDVKAVITEAAHVFNEPETIAGVRTARPLLEEGKMDGLREYHGERYKEVFFAWNNIWLDESFTSWDISHLLPQIEAPNLIIQGLDDQYGTQKQVEVITNLTSGKSTALTPNKCGHAPFKEQTATVTSAVQKFIHGID